MGFWSGLAKVAGVAAPIVGGFLGGPLGAAAGSLVGGALNKNKGTTPAQSSGASDVPSSDQVQQDQAAFRGMSAAERTRATQLQSSNDQANASFDPQAYATQAAGAQAKQYGELAKNMEAARNVATARRGFLGSPIGSGAQTRDLNTRIATDVSANAQQAAGQRLSQIQGAAGVAENSANRAFESQSDIANSGVAQRQQAAQDAARKKASTLGFIGNLAGSAIGAAGQYLANRKPAGAGANG